MTLIFNGIHALDLSLFHLGKLLLRHTVIADEIEVDINLLRGLHGPLII